MKHALTTFAILLALSSTNPAQAQNTGNDARCFLLANVFAKSADTEQAKRAASVASYYYLGRLTSFPAQIEATLATEIAFMKTLKKSDAGLAMAFCAKVVGQQMAAMVATAQKLSTER